MALQSFNITLKYRVPMFGRYILRMSQTEMYRKLQCLLFGRITKLFLLTIYDITNKVQILSSEYVEQRGVTCISWTRADAVLFHFSPICFIVVRTQFKIEDYK